MHFGIFLLSLPTAATALFTCLEKCWWPQSRDEKRYWGLELNEGGIYLFYMVVDTCWVIHKVIYVESYAVARQIWLLLHHISINWWEKSVVLQPEQFCGSSLELSFTCKVGFYALYVILFGSSVKCLQDVSHILSTLLMFIMKNLYSIVIIYILYTRCRLILKSFFTAAIVRNAKFGLN